MPKFETGKPKTGGRKAGTPNATTGEARALAHRLLNSPRYRKAFRARLEAGQLAPALETMLWSCVYGRPPADAPEPLAPTPAEPLRALAVKLLRLEGEDFRMALAGIFAHEISTAPPKALPEGGNPNS
jgi:hypothetical protein